MSDGIIYKQLAGIMAEAKAIGKDSKNQQQGFNFRGIDAVMNHLHPLFTKHGVIILPEVLDDKSEERKTKSGGNLIYRILRIAFNFTASDGSSARCVVMGEGMDSGDKAATKAMAVALKYALTQMLLLPYDEVDPDKTTPPPSTPTTPATTKVKTASVPQRKKMFATAKERGIDEAQLKAIVKAVCDVDSTKDIPAAAFDKVLKAVENAEPKDENFFQPDGSPRF